MTLLPAALLLAGAIAFVAARAGTSASIVLANRRSVLAHPDGRTSHATPTPRLGGIGLFAGMVAGGFVVVALARGLGDDVGGVLLTSARQVPPLWLVSCAACCTAAFATGLVDDFRNVPPLGKLAGQMAAAAPPALAGVFPASVELPSGVGTVSPFLGGAIAFCFIVLMINVVNFIDGINGLAGRLCQVALLVLLISTSPDAPGGLALILGSFIALLAIEGFLTLNESRASTFMGDGGSHLLGAFVACALLLSLSSETPARAPVLALLLPVCVPVFDVVATLVRRARRGEPLLSAHREHLYQRHLLATGEDHARTRLFVLAHAGAAAGLALFVMLREDLTAWAAVALTVFGAAVVCASYWAQVVVAEREEGA